MNMKNVLCLGLFVVSFLCFAQNDNRQINKYLVLKKTEKGYVFTDNKGKESKEYTYVYLKDNGFIETIIVPPIDPEEIKRFQSIPIDTTRYEKCGYPIHDNSIRKDYHVLELMKELKIIDDYNFMPFDDLTWANVRDGRIDDFGCVSKDGKYAMVTNKGEFLTDFKYNNYFYFDNNKPIFNNYTENGKLVTVVLDKFTGKELLATKDSLVRYWDVENYLIKNSKGKYILTYLAKKHTVPEIWKHVKNLSVESSLFTYQIVKTPFEYGFITLDGKKVEPEKEIIPLTNFYNGHCIATETIAEDQKYDYYGRALPQKRTTIWKIINEQFETVKLLPKVNGFWHDPYFNKYGQVIVENSEVSSNYFVIDFNGNHIIPPSIFPNRIHNVYPGVYEVVDYGYLRTNESQQQENFYNQKGEKLANQETLRITRDLEFKEGLDENYLVSNGFKMVTLSKENNVINSYYE